MKHILNQCPVIAILRNLPEDLLIPYAESILRGGISVFEVAMNTPDGAGQISALKEHFKVGSLTGLGLADYDCGIIASGALLIYLKETQKTSLSHMSRLIPYLPENICFSTVLQDGILNFVKL